jgi:hypothetical protein
MLFGDRVQPNELLVPVHVPAPLTSRTGLLEELQSLARRFGITIVP